MLIALGRFELPSQGPEPYARNCMLDHYTTGLLILIIKAYFINFLDMLKCMEEKIKNIIKKIIDKKYIYLASSGSEAIKHLANLLKYKTFLIQDQCALPEYRNADSYNEVKTNYGIIDLKDLNSKCQNKILIINGLNHYFAEQPISEIVDLCKGKNCFVVNDVSGSFGLNSARLGDYTLCNFGSDDTINLGYGGFLASNTELNVAEDFDKGKLDELYEKLTNLDARSKYLYWINEKVKKDLNSFEIIHKDKRGVNVLIKFYAENEKKKIMKYCEKNQLDATLNPKYIKSTGNMVAININKK